jgi:hypothetical protein
MPPSARFKCTALFSQAQVAQLQAEVKAARNTASKWKDLHEQLLKFSEEQTEALEAKQT